MSCGIDLSGIVVPMMQQSLPPRGSPTKSMIQVKAPSRFSSAEDAVGGSITYDEVASNYLHRRHVTIILEVADRPPTTCFCPFSLRFLEAL